MATSAAAQIMRQAEAVKTTMTESDKNISDLWVSRQKLEDLYKKLLLVDLEYALDKKVEQELWNHAFKNQINILQTQSKDRQNPKKAEANASLMLFLETASGFYLQFLQTICSTFKLDLPFRRRSAAFGVMNENTTNYKKIVTPKKSSCLYISCHCLVHLGDIARYRGEMWQAQTYYRHAANLSPNNGQPYNQLAILEACKGDKLSTVFYYVRSLAVRHPFPVAATNLEKFYSKLIKDTRSDFEGPNLTMTDIILAFLQFHALLHMSTGLDRAAYLRSRITAALGGHIRSQSVSAAHLTGMAAISIFALQRARCDVSDGGEATRKCQLSTEEERTVRIHLGFSAKLLETMLQHTPKEDNKARDFLTLPAIKVMFDWLSANRDVLQTKEFNNSSIWQEFVKLLNIVQWLLNDTNKAAEMSRYEDMPLPEDADLRCFQPLEPAYSTYNFNKALTEELNTAVERDVRCQRIVAHGRWISLELPSLSLISYQPNKSVRTQFSTQKVANLPEGSQSVPKPSPRPAPAMQTIMKKRSDTDKAPGTTSPLSVISEEGKSVSGEASSDTKSEKSGASGGGVIKLHHKSAALNQKPQKSNQSNQKSNQSNQKSNQSNQKPNLPPRLSAKAGASQSASQKKGQRGSNSAGRGGGQSSKTEVAEPPPAFTPAETFPGITPDSFPAMVNQRTQASLIPSENTSQNSNCGISSGPAPWGNLSANAIMQSSAPSGNPGRASSPSVESSNSANSRSPQPSPNMPPMGFGSMDSSRGMDMGTDQTGLNFPCPTPSADFMSAIRSANQFVQKQQQQQQQHGYQMMPSDVQQSSQQPFAPRHNYSQQHRMLAAQHQKHQLDQFARSPPTHPGFFPQAPLMGDSQGMSQSTPGIFNSLSTTATPMTIPPPTTYQGSRGDINSRGFLPNPAPVGFIPPSSLVSGSASVQGGAHHMGGYRGMQHAQSQQQHIAQGSQQQSQSSGGLLYQNIPLRGGGGATSSATAGDMSPEATGLPPGPPPPGAMYPVRPQGPGGQNPSFAQFLTQQQQQQSSYHRGKGQMNQDTKMSQDARLLSQDARLSSSQDMRLSQDSRLSGQDTRLSQDPRLSATFQGHAAGTPKPEKGFPADIQPGQMMKGQKPHHQHNHPPQQQQQRQHQHQQQGPHQSMIHNMMDPPFLQASGEYSLFSNSASPAWPSPLNDTRGQQAGGGRGGKSQHDPNMANMPPGMPGTTHSFNGGNLQGMWSSSGPSPLQRLLEQQRSQRQPDN